MKKRFISILIAFLLVFSFAFTVACRDDDSESTIQPFADTGIVLADNGATDYKVVIPENASEWEKFAADEMVLFFRKSTGVTLQIIKDTGLTFNENDYYLSIGNTKILEGSGVTVSYSELGRDGYKVVRKGNTVILAGGGGYGNIYAVYGFLNKQVDFKAYAANELYVKQVKKLTLLNYEWTDVPDFETRAGGYYVTQYDKKFATRSRTLAGYNTRLYQTNGIWGSWAHTHFTYISKDTYMEDHPEWFGANATQLCLSNMEMREELIKNLKAKILSNVDSELWMIGQEDKSTFCTCENCMPIIDEVGKSGLMMQFINYVADAIAKWQETACPEREITILTFAYQQTEAPPVAQTSDGGYAPINESVIAHDNVCVMLAPIQADYLAPYNDPIVNSSTKFMFDGWATCSKKLVVWSYCNNFSQRLEYFDNISAIATNYKFFKDLGITYLYDESSGSAKQGFAFQQMMAFVHSELMWDCEQNVNDLINDFMIHYYKEAYEPMLAYWNLISNFVTQRKLELGAQNKTYYGTAIWNDRPGEQATLLSSEFWSKQVLEQMILYLDQACDIIEDNYFDEDDKETMLDRVKIESLTPRMYLIHLFSDVINADEYLEMVDAFEQDAMRMGITSVFQTLKEQVAGWRARVA